jgi:phytoene desaturase
MEPRLLQSAWFRPHNRSEELPGLFLVGAGTHPGAGVPGVLMSAQALETVLPPLPRMPAVPAVPARPLPRPEVLAR